MDKLLEIMPIFLLAIAQLIQSRLLINLNRRTRALEEYKDMVLKTVHEAALEVIENGTER